MFELTHKQIKEDIKNSIHLFESEEVKIPSIWQCLKVGLLFIIGFPSWVALVCFNEVRLSYGSPVCDASILAALFIGLFVAGQIYVVKARYLALPTSILNDSIIIKMLKSKVMIYLATYLILIFLSGLYSKIFVFSPWLCSGSMVVGFILFNLVFMLDMSRFDLSLLNSAISAWRNGDRIENK